MREVWRFALRVGELTIVEAGPGKVVLVAMDPVSGVPAVWIEHTRADLPPPRSGVTEVIDTVERRLFIVVRSGDSVEEGWNHVGSMIARSHVLHVYERGAQP